MSNSDIIVAYINRQIMNSKSKILYVNKHDNLYDKKYYI